jgi:hypothetical protein
VLGAAAGDSSIKHKREGQLFIAIEIAKKAPVKTAKFLLTNVKFFIGMALQA